MARKPVELDFETTLAQLEAIVSQLENGDLPLEEALKEFENGVKLAKLGQERLQQAEQRIQILLQKSDDAPLADYQPDA
ncbi:exodeoxyribonuclease VII small subunit [Pasteurella langaaensis DSM 22999]|uniref:Exodeoxyribonuclease 7 small subunit n=1 Tax=Alitibacter langaaensis DSM 22999 TaxID=1122935 RepID=A0A2U0SQ26_9PAST|nr:exodeoxyribonuclease VII small subunit [Pasteurella langaaensis]PVX33434.1 exodeoxyribonuclease VII small subunit [Pasteurella langaaensis DSM 22999]